MKNKSSFFGLFLLVIGFQNLFAQHVLIPNYNDCRSHHIVGDTLWQATLSSIIARSAVTGEVLATWDANTQPLLRGFISNMFVDSEGKKWILLSFRGVVLWDGATWTSWDIDNTPVFSEFNDFQSIKRDKNGLVWLLHGDDVYRYDGVEWALASPSLLWASRLFLDHEGNIVVVTAAGVQRFKNGAWELYQSAKDIAWNVIFKDDKEAYVADFYGKIYSLSLEFDTMYLVDSFEGSSAYTLDNQGNLWVSSARRLGKFDGNSWEKHFDSTSLLWGFPESITVLDDGSVWISRSADFDVSGGLCRFKNGEFKDFPLGLFPSEIYQRRTGQMGTFNAISTSEFFDASSNAQYAKIPESFLGHPIIPDPCSDDKNWSWSAASSYKWTLWDGSGATAFHDSVHDNYLDEVNYLQATSSVSGKVYFMSDHSNPFEDQIIEYSCADETWKKYSKSAGTSPFNFFFGNVVTDGTGSLWAKTQHKVGNLKNGQWTVYDIAVPGVFAGGRGNDLWYSGPSAVFHFDGGSIQQFALPSILPANTSVDPNFVDSKGNVWAICAHEKSDGLFEFWVAVLDADRVWHVFSQQDLGLGGNPSFLGSFREDNEGKIWIGVEFLGLVRFDGLLSNLNSPGPKIIEINVYPNPAAENIEVVLARPEPTRVQIFDLFGKLVLEKTFSGNFSLDATGWQSGIYVMVATLRDAHEASIVKFCVQH